MTVLTLQSYNPTTHDVPALPGAAFAVTPSDTIDFSEPVSLEVHVAGALKVLPFYGDHVGAATPITIPAGVAVLGYRPPFRVKRVYSTDTTATVIGVF
jgi:hypothetical protein